MFHNEQYKKNISFNVLLPNLRYINKELYFKPKHIIKIKRNNKIENKSEFLLKNIKLEGNINFMDLKFKCKILEESLKNGVKAHIEVNTDKYISRTDIQKCAKELEACILNIHLDDDNSSESCDNYENKIKYLADNMSDNHSYTEENNNENNYYDDFDDYQEEYYSDS